MSRLSPGPFLLLLLEVGRYSQAIQLRHANSRTPTPKPKVAGDLLRSLDRAGSPAVRDPSRLAQGTKELPQILRKQLGLLHCRKVALPSASRSSARCSNRALRGTAAAWVAPWEKAQQPPG